MRQKTQQEELIVRYLLGELTEEERVQIEQRFMAEDEYFEQICAVEAALVDAYVQETLTEPERRKVESLLLSSPQQAREIKYTRELIGYISKPLPGEITAGTAAPAAPPGKWQSLLRLLHIKTTGRQFVLAAVFGLIAVGSCLMVWNLALQRQLESLRARQAVMEERNQELQQRIEQQAQGQDAISKELQSERDRRERIEGELAALQASPPLPATNGMATLDLKNDSFSRSGGELKVVYISGITSRLQISIHLDQEAYKIYRAGIKTFEGQAIWSRDQIRPRPGNYDRIILTLPAHLFANHDYILTLEGHSETGRSVEIGDYPFRVRR